MKKVVKYSYLRKVLSDEGAYINRYLRIGNRNNTLMEKIISEINKTLDETPAYNNNIVHHYGYIGHVTIEELSIYFGKRKGCNIQWPSFLSTTKNPKAFKGQIKVFQIHTSDNSNGKDVTTLEFEKPNEDEVTFKNDTFFKVVEVQPDLITLCELTEIPEKYEVLGEDFYMKDEEINERLNKCNQKVKEIPSASDLNII